MTSKFSYLTVIAALFFGSIVMPLDAEAAEWDVQFAPYLWFAGLEGDVATLPGLPPASIDLSFSDVMENFEIGFMATGEFRNGSFGFFMDVIYIDVEPGGAAPGPFFSSVKVDAETLVLTGTAFYRIAESGGAFLDLMAGARLWSIDTTLTLGAGALPAVTVSNAKTWVDPMIGFKGKTPIGASRFFASGGALIGGIGIASDFVYDLWGNVGYSWTESFDTSLGYRHFGVDYKKGSFLYDVEQSGPTLGLSFRF